MYLRVPKGTLNDRKEYAGESDLYRMQWDKMRETQK